MRNKYGSIILIIIILLLLSGALLFFAKDNVVSFLDDYENLSDLAKPLKISSSVVTLDDSVIKSELFKSLKNNVNNFSFADICSRPNGAAVPVAIAATSSDAAASSTPPAGSNIGCRQGNNAPFLLLKKK